MPKVSKKAKAKSTTQGGTTTAPASVKAAK